MKSAFLMHPLDASYVARSTKAGAHIWARYMPAGFIEKALLPIKPFVQSRFKMKEHDSMIIISPLTSRQMMTCKRSLVLKKLRDACELAYEEGARIISLGAYSAIASNQGSDLVGKTRIGLTTGRTYTVSAVMEQARPFLTKNSHVAVIGAEGAIGSAVNQLAKGYKITKITRKNTEAIYDADIIISASSTINSFIEPGKLKERAVVIDAAKPSDLSQRTLRGDITRIDGGVITVPGDVNFGIDFDLGRNRVYACIAEAFILGMAGKEGNYCVGRNIDLNKVEEIGKLASYYGFKVV